MNNANTVYLDGVLVDKNCMIASSLISSLETFSISASQNYIEDINSSSRIIDSIIAVSCVATFALIMNVRNSCGA